MKDTQTKERLIELRAQGWSYDRIAGELKVSKPTLIRWSRELHLEIANARAVALDAVQEKFAASKVKRVELFGETLNALKTELEKRKLDDVPTEKLLDYILKYGTTLKNEATPIEFSRKEDLNESLLNNMGHAIAKWAG